MSTDVQYEWACNTCGTVWPEHQQWCEHCKDVPPKRGGQKRVLVPVEHRSYLTQRVNADRTPVLRRLRKKP